MPGFGCLRWLLSGGTDCLPAAWEVSAAALSGLGTHNDAISSGVLMPTRVWKVCRGFVIPTSRPLDLFGLESGDVVVPSAVTIGVFSSTEAIVYC